MEYDILNIVSINKLVIMPDNEDKHLTTDEYTEQVSMA